MKSYKDKNYEQALIESYLKFDELLRDSRVNSFLKESSKAKNDIVIDYSIDYEFKTYITSSVITGLNKENQSYKTPKQSSDNETKDILLLNDRKLEISLKGNIKEAKGELVAMNMGTTANILLIRNHYFYLSNVGDSLAVLYKNGEAIRLNQEHKTSLQSEYARINKSGAKIINNRIDGRLNLTRAIGIAN
jgi:serine/threonine protein phosphatase PrpC